MAAPAPTPTSFDAQAGPSSPPPPQAPQFPIAPQAPPPPQAPATVRYIDVTNKSVITQQELEETREYMRHRMEAPNTTHLWEHGFRVGEAKRVIELWEEVQEEGSRHKWLVSNFGVRMDIELIHNDAHLSEKWNAWLNARYYRNEITIAGKGMISTLLPNIPTFLQQDFVILYGEVSISTCI